MGSYMDNRGRMTITARWRNKIYTNDHREKKAVKTWPRWLSASLRDGDNGRGGRGGGGWYAFEKALDSEHDSNLTHLKIWYKYTVTDAKSVTIFYYNYHQSRVPFITSRKQHDGGNSQLTATAPLLCNDVFFFESRCSRGRDVACLWLTFKVTGSSFHNYYFVEIPYTTTESYGAGLFDDFVW